MRALHILCGVEQNKNVGMWVFDIAQCVLVAKPDNLNMIPGTQMVEKYQLLNVVL